MAQERDIVLITGGGRGIGAATAVLAARRGYDVIVNYREDTEAATRIVTECSDAGARAIAVRADIAEEGGIDTLFAEVDRFGRLSHLVNNAGATGSSGRLDATDPDLIRRIVDVNLTAAILVARAAVLRMATSHGGAGGSIVNISSVAAALGSAGEYVWYAAAKAGIDGFTYGLGRELARDGVRVNAVQPGMIDTDIHERSTGDPGRLARVTPQIPMQRPGTAEEIAEAVLFLMSPASAYTTASILRVSGGR